MADEKEMFLLHFNSFESNISSTWQSLHRDNDFSDVTIACDDNPNHQIQAHKIILSSFSPVFNHLLRISPGKKPLLYLRGVKYDELVDMMDYIYKGEVNIVTEELNNFIALAQDLKIKGLTEDMPTNVELILSNSNPRIKYPHAETETIDLSKSPPKSPEKRKRISPVKEEKNPTTSIKNEDDCPVFKMDLSASVSGDIVEEEKYETFPPHMTTITNEDKEITEEDEEIGMLAWEESMLSQEEDENDDRRCKKKQSNSPRQDVALYTCEHCNYKTPRKYNLQQHVGSMHEGVRYSCEQCNFKTPRRYNLDQHIKSMHEGVRYKCDHCEYVATKKAYLKIHVAKKHSQFLKN